MTTIDIPLAETTTETLAERTRRTVPFPAKLAAAGLVLGAGGNTLQPVLKQIVGERPEAVADQVRFAAEHEAGVTAMLLSGTLAVPFMAIGFAAAAHLLARHARRTGVVAGSLLLLGMFGFMAIQTSGLIQLTALLDGDVAAATYLDDAGSNPLLGVLFGLPFMVGCVLGMLTLTIGLLVKGAGVPRWIPAAWLAFILLDFSIGAVGPVDPHWLYFAGAVGLAVHITRDGARAWRNA